MGERARFYLAHWDRLQKAIRTQGSMENYWNQYEDTGDEELIRIDLPPLNHFGGAAIEAYEVYECLAPQLPSATGESLECLLRSFGISEGPTGVPHDLDETVPSCISMSPATVEEIAEACSQLKLDDLRSPFLSCPSTRAFPDWDSFESYLQGFMDLLKTAKEAGGGLIVTVA